MRLTLLPLAVGVIALRAARASAQAVYSACFDANGNIIDCAVFDLDNDDDSFLDDQGLTDTSPKTDEWDCDIRSWTRAPDLLPGHQIPGETRLWVNGTGCRDIESWELGLRLKERAIVKVRYVTFHLKATRARRSVGTTVDD
jgi:hypothetical protein